MKGKKSLSLITVIIVLAAAVLICGTAVAAGFRVEEDYTGTARNDSYTINGGSFIAEWTEGSYGAELSFTVNYLAVNPSSPRLKFDLAVTVESGTAAVAGLTAEVTSFYGGIGYVFRGITHERSGGGDMSVTVALNGVTGKVKAGVVASGNNVFIADEYGLNYINNENLYNPYYESNNGGWQEIGSAPYVNNGGNVAITLDGGVINGTLNESNGTLILESRNFVFKSLKLAGAGELEFYLRDGKYVNFSYGIRLTLSSGAVLIESVAYAYPSGYAEIYLLNEVKITSATTLTIPSRINLFYGGLILNAPLNIKHSYAGAYTVDSPKGGQIDNSLAPLNIETPFGYYDRDKLTAAVTDSNNITITDAADNADSALNLVEYAVNYITAYLPSSVYSDIVLPEGYGDLRIKYTYAFGEGIDEYGRVVRKSDSYSVPVTVGILLDGSAVDTVEKTVTVTGTSESALASHFAKTVKGYIALNSDGVNSYFAGSADLLNLIKTSLVGAGFTAKGRILAGNELKFRFFSDNTAFEGEELIIDGGTLTLNDKGTLVTQSAINGVTAVYLSAKSEITDASETSITFGYDYVDSVYQSSLVIVLNVKGMDYAQKTAYLERFYEIMYVSDATTRNYILQVSGQGIYRGEIIESNKIISSDLGLNAINYGFYIGSAADLTAYENGEITSEELVARSINNNGLFTYDYDGGFVVPAGRITLTEGRELFAAIKADFNTTTVGETEYTAIRRVIIPAGGIGGNDYTQYTKGDTFAPYFDALDQNMLIDSVADTDSVNGNANRFLSDTDGVLLEMEILNIADVTGAEGQTFCRLVYNTAGKYYQIDIDPENIPSKDTAVRLSAVFYILNSDNSRTVISEQKYGFIIPGIYKLGRDIFSDALYNRMLEIYLDFNGYLLVRGTETPTEVFDCSAAFINPSEAVDLTGIELLKNTKKIILDGVKVLSLAPFKNFTEFNLTSLSMADCGITNAMLGAEFPLYNLVGLTELNLENNAIDGIDGASPYFYRTVTALDLSGQRINGDRCLTDLNGLNALPELSVLDVSENAIRSFAPLTECAKLSAVNLSGNIAEEFGGKNGDGKIYYGSSGLINKPVYVVLQSRKVTVTGDTAILYSNEEKEAAILINAVSVFNTQYGSITLPSKLYSGTTEGDVYFNAQCVYLIVNMNAVGFTKVTDGDKDIITSEFLNSGDKVSAILELRYGDTLIYKQFEFNFREAS